eukprot:636767-Heterocapsa_arctica.AAC.1
MEYGRPGERTNNTITVMGIVSYVAKRMRVRQKEQHQPECFWNTGVVTTDWTTLPESEHMKTYDLCHECKGTAKT